MKKLVFWLTIFLPVLFPAQSALSNFLEEYDQYVINANVHQGWRTMGELSFGRAMTEEWKYERVSAVEWEVGSEFNFDPKHFILAPKFSVNGSAFIFNFGSSLVYYTDFNKGTLYLNPHIGISAFAYVDLYCGYNIPLMRNNMKPWINRFTVTLAVPIIFDKYGF